MYKKFSRKASNKTIKHNNGYVGETIENKVRRIMNNKEATIS